MKKISLIPTSELIFSCVYPESSVLASSKDIEKEVFDRLLNSYHLDLDSAHKVFDLDAAIIQERGNNLDNYFFNCDKEFDKYLEALVSYLANVPCLISNNDDSNGFTFSELVMFKVLLYGMVRTYANGQKQLGKDIRDYSKSIQRVIRSNKPIAEIDMKYAELKSIRENSERILEIQEQYSLFWNEILKKIYSKLALLMGCQEDGLRIDINILYEQFRLACSSNHPEVLNKDLQQYKQDNCGRVEHDQKILSKYDVSTFTRQ